MQRFLFFNQFYFFIKYMFMFLWCSCYQVFSCLCCVLLVVICLFVILCFALALPVQLRGRSRGRRTRYAPPLKLEGGLWFFVSFRIFFWTTQQFEYYFFLSRKARIFFPEFNIRLYDKNFELDYFFSSTRIRIFFSATLGIRIFKKKKKNITPPCKLNGWSLILPKTGCYQMLVCYQLQ